MKLLSLSFVLLLCSLCTSKLLLAQNQQPVVKGTVISSKDVEPLPGVTITVKGSNKMTSTDANGQFTISVPDLKATLLLSSAGYKKMEYSLGGNAIVQISMEPSQNSMDEVVIIGYGRQNRATVTTSVTKVGKEEFENAPGQNPLLQLQGKVAGLSLQISDGQPGSNPQIFIRGGSSTSPEGDAPLFIVDGIVGQMRNISDINPDDIESMQVLKDAASTAIYGARAANGVIIIKTKSGRRGKPIINFKYTNGIETQGKEYDFTSARDYVYVTRRNIQQFNKTNPEFFLTGGRYGMSTGNARNSKGTLEFLDTYIQNYGADYVSDLIDNQGWETMDDPVTGKKLIFKETNYQDVTFQNTYRRDFDFNIGGGTDKATYYLGLGHLDQKGIVLGTWYKNYSALFNGTYKLSEAVTLNANFNYQLRQSSGIGNYQNVLSRSVTMPFTYRLTYEDGKPAPGEGVGSFRNRNHEVYYRDQYNKNQVNRATYNLGATVNIIPGLSFMPSFYWFTTEGIEGRFEAFNEVNPNREVTAAHNYDRQSQLDGLLNYDKSFGKHNLNAVFGASYINRYEYRMSGSGRGAPTDYIKTLNATAPETQRITSRERTDIMMSYFGRATYDYNKRYMVAASLRRDGSSKFSQENKWGLYPGLSAGWNMHNEKFWAPIEPFVQKFKLRSSWGQTGNNEIDPLDSQGGYAAGYTYGGEVGILNTVLANNTLVWETTTSFDAGVEIGLFNNRLGINIDFYNKVTSDRIFDKPLDGSTGFATIKSNYGSIRNRGIDIEIEATPIRTRNFSWTLNANYSFIRSTVLKLPATAEDKNRIGGNTIYDPVSGQYVRVGGLAEGERFGGRWAYHLIGVYATDEDAKNAPYDVEAAGRLKVGGDAIWQDVDGNGRIDNNDMVFMGYIRPDKTGGMVNTLTYKKLTMRFVMDFAIGHVIDNSFRGRLMASARNNNMALSDVLGSKVWQNQGDIAEIPRYTVQSDADYNYRNHLRGGNSLGTGSGYSTNNSLYYSKGDFLAFREVSFNYSLRMPALRKAYINSIDIFAGVYNIGYLTTYTGLMPEIYIGADQGSYPRPRQFSFGAKLGL
ncbi:SusC/RagA family TonB-linked outer membrane protein [Pseudoflavitalea rhizosphaerae]|uniref:SusC/RagA family TonB-linked outer membrane protein n=1 Tax=Pseudoflavitalea rhizosphaerae TaxID=1884793 RepID=UPI000F8DDDAE|nr:SusC/RagA family TonB-linked outer membrane protein [Pseudoflavitalea rhizosphaerae]